MGKARRYCAPAATVPVTGQQLIRVSGAPWALLRAAMIPHCLWALGREDEISTIYLNICTCISKEI